MPSIFTLLPTKSVRGVSFALASGLDKTPLNEAAQRLKDVEALRVDAALTQRHSSNAEPTRNPVEDGLEITDHVDRKPYEFSITGIITDTPLDTSSLITAGVTSVAGIAGRAFTKANNINARSGAALTAGVSAAAAFGAGQLFGSAKNRVQTALQILQACQEQAVLLKIITRLKTYDSMILTNLEVNLDKSNGSSLPFTGTLVEIRIVKSETIVDKNLLDPLINHSTSSKNLGNQSDTTATPAEEKKARGSSVAVDWFG